MLICICLFLSIICFQIRVILLVLPQFVISCREPKDLAAQLDRLHEEMLNITLSGTPTYGILPPYRRNNPLYQTSQFKHKSLKFRIYGKAKCKRLRYFERSHLNYRSSCPWYVFLDYDVDRLPQTMAKAECSCRKCFNTLKTVNPEIVGRSSRLFPLFAGSVCPTMFTNTLFPWKRFLLVAHVLGMSANDE